MYFSKSKNNIVNIFRVSLASFFIISGHKIFIYRRAKGL